MPLASDVIQFHEVASIFPMMEGDDFAELMSDIKEKGLLVPILLAEGKIADGRNRYKACRELDVEPWFTEWDGAGDLLAHVVSLNLFRRHLTTSQRAMIGAEIKPRFEAEAKARLVTSTGGSSPRPLANMPEAETGNARDKAAEAVNVSPRMVEAASRVLANGTPELIKSVKDGQVKVSAAVEIVGLPEEEQVELVAKGPAAVKKKAAETRATRTQFNLGTGPSFPPIEGVPRPTKFWMKNTTFLNDVVISVREQGGILGSVHGWSPDQVSRLDLQLSAFKEKLDQWIDILRNHQ